MDDNIMSKDAIHFVKTWKKHRRDLEENTLRYLDNLMDALARVEPISPDDMRLELCSVVPLLPYGTARRLVALKYHNPPENLQIQAA